MELRGARDSFGKMIVIWQGILYNEAIKNQVLLVFQDKL